MSQQDSDSDEMYCEKHGLNSPAYEDGPDPHCPYCREERRIEAERHHRLTRDRTLEPW